MFDGLPGRFQQQPVLRIDRGRLALPETEERGVEARDVVQEPAPPRHRPTGHALLGVVVLVGVPPLGWDLGDQVVAPQQRLPELLGRVDAAGKPAGHSDHCNGSDRGFAQSRLPLL